MRRKLNRHPFRDTMQTHIEVTIAGNRVWVHWNDFFISDIPTIFVRQKKTTQILGFFSYNDQKTHTENKIADDTNRTLHVISIYKDIHICMYVRTHTYI